MCEAAAERASCTQPQGALSLHDTRCLAWVGSPEESVVLRVKSTCFEKLLSLH